MTFLLYLLLGFAAWSLLTTHRQVKQSRTERERAFFIRVTAVCWGFGILFVAAMIYLPNKGRVLMFLPAFFIAVSLAKAWRNTRTRLERERDPRVDLERMKRVN